MKLSLILFLVLVIASSFDAVAQGSKDHKNPAQAADDLRLQLLEVEAKESELQARMKQLDEDLKPENIERYFAGVGSTKPEELREMRRRQLNIERGRVQAQLKLVATSRERLESVILFAESQAYQESAEATGAPLQMLRGNFATGRRVIAGALIGLATILGFAFVIVMLTRRVNPA